MGTLSSMLWATNGVGDGTATGYTDAQIQRMMKLINAIDPATEGVFYGELNNLEVTSPGANSISINTGAAMIRGIIAFHDTSATAIALTSVAADTAGIVWMQADWSTQLVTLGVTQATSGDTNTPALTQTAGTTWQIPLATYTLASDGTVTITETDYYLNAFLTEEFVPAKDPTTLTNADTTTYNWSYWKAPSDALLGREVTIKPVLYAPKSATPGNAYMTIYAGWGDYVLEEVPAGVAGTASNVAYAVPSAGSGSGTFFFSPTTVTIEGTQLTKDDILNINVWRSGTHANDTFSADINYIGSVVTYWKLK